MVTLSRSVKYWIYLPEDSNSSESKVYFTLILAPKMGTLVLSGGLHLTDDDTPKEWTTHVSFKGEEQQTLLIYHSCCLLMYLTISCDITMFWQRFTRTLNDGIDNMVNFPPIPPLVGPCSHRRRIHCSTPITVCKRQTFNP